MIAIGTDILRIARIDDVVGRLGSASSPAS